MQFSKLIKAAAIAIPLFAITACSSDGSSNNSNSGNNNGDVLNNSLSKSEQAAIESLQKNNTIYFDFDKYNVKNEFEAMLDSHADFLRNHSDVNVIIEGHADERGTPEYNIALGERRASSVKTYLQGHGVSAQQLSIVSYGKEKPAVLGHDQAAYAKNRRAVIAY